MREKGGVQTGRELPAGWRWVRLSEVCGFVNGNAYKESDWSSEGVPIIRIQNLNDPTKPFNYWAGPLDNLVCVRDGDLLLAWSGTPGTSFGAHIWLRGDSVLNQHIFLVRTDEKALDKGWAKHAINQALESLIRAAHGAVGLAHVTRREVEQLKIPLPPLPEQQRIAAILTEQMAAVDRARQAAEERLEAIRAMPAALLRQVFPQAGQEMPVGWRAMKLEEFGDIASGVTLGRKVWGGQTRQVPYLRVANVKDSRLDLSDVYQIEATEDEIQKLRLQPGDLLLTEGGDADKLGRGVYWEGQIPECIHQNHIFRVRFDQAHFSPQFLSFLIGSPYGKAYFLRHAKQTTGIATINQKVLANFPLMFPSLPEQQRIAAILTERMAAAEQARQAAETELATINALPAALLRRAFSGEL